MSMLLQVALNVDATATGKGVAVACNTSPFLGFMGKNAIAKCPQQPTGAAVWALEGCGRKTDGSTPGANDAGWAAIYTWNAAAGNVTPTAPTGATAGTGGTLVHSTTYYYRVSEVTATGETLASVEMSQATGANGGADTNTVTLTFAAASSLTVSRKVYGRSTGAELLMATLPVATATWVDTGAITPAGALPTRNTTAVPRDADITLTDWVRYNITTLGTGELNLVLYGVQ